MRYICSRSLLTSASIFVFLSNFPATGASGRLLPDVSPGTSPARAIVIGFVGGFVGHNNAIHSEVQLAQSLADAYPSSLQVRIFENHRGRQARLEVLRLLDRDQDGTLSFEEKNSARIAIYGHSWGASEAVNLARRLAGDQIPVVLTIQVDSVRKPGEDDASIPPNVMQAVNFYQLDGLLHGRSQIRAADPSRTWILGNFQFEYKSKPVVCEGYPWYARLFMKPHIEIESDPAVWRRVESLIHAKLLTPPAGD